MTISSEDRTKLVTLARQTIAAAVTNQPSPAVENAAGLLTEQRGCFVTITNAGKLRGCIGTFQPDRPLGEMIIEMAQAATHDPRFTGNPITAGELDQLTIEVSVLSPLKKTDHPEQLEIGRHGIYIVAGYRSGCFLPEVATDYNMAAEEFLDTCCQHKANLPAGAWKNPDTEVYLFTSEKFEE